MCGEPRMNLITRKLLLTYAMGHGALKLLAVLLRNM